jgi:hypothetical protein
MARLLLTASDHGLLVDVSSISQPAAEIMDSVEVVACQLTL